MPRMRRRPIRRVATMAVIGGGAYALGRSGGKSSAQDEQSKAAAEAEASAASAAAGDQKVDKLKELGELRTSGVLTEEEFAAEKKKILDS